MVGTLLIVPANNGNLCRDELLIYFCLIVYQVQPLYV